MKNKIFSVIAAAAVCGAMLTSQAYAEDVTTDVSIYAPNAEEIAERINNSLPEELGIIVKADTIMPVYLASIYDYLKTGKFEFTPDTAYGNQTYFADIVNDSGNFAGVMQFVIDKEHNGTLLHAPRDDEALAIDYRANVERISRLMSDNNISTDIKEAKIAAVDGLGYVYYLNNGTDEVFIKTEFKGGSQYFFTAENGGIVVVNDEFKAAVGERLAEMIALEELYEGNPPTGGTADSISAVLALAACGVAFAAYVKKRNGKSD